MRWWWNGRREQPDRSEIKIYREGYWWLVEAITGDGRRAWLGIQDEDDAIELAINLMSHSNGWREMTHT